MGLAAGGGRWRSSLHQSTVCRQLSAEDCNDVRAKLDTVTSQRGGAGVLTLCYTHRPQSAADLR